MPSPFPGMDPYLENPGLWSEVHHNLITECQGLLGSQLRPKYIVKIEERVYVTDESDEEFNAQIRIPDIEVARRTGWESAQSSLKQDTSQLEIPEPVVATTWFEEEIHQAYLTIIDRTSGEVVTVIEILSPANKVPKSPGRESFEQKRREVMNSPTHWVEIDLLRGKRMTRVPKKLGPHQYLIHVSRKTETATRAALGNHLAAASPGHPHPTDARRSGRPARSPGRARYRLRSGQLRSADRLSQRAATSTR